MSNIKQDDEKRRWSISRRMEFIELRLYWDGRVNRSDLVDFFGISVPQASNDLGRYMEQAPKNMAYDGRTKAYLATQDFSPMFSKPDAQSYFTQLRLFSEGILPKEASWLGWLPAHESVPTIARSVDPEKLRRVLECIRTKCALEVEYQSLSRPDPLRRWISPHALAYDGFRWHVRAWCHTRNNFQDFVLARMLDIAQVKPGNTSPESDLEWHQFISMKIGPHPALEVSARKAIEIDYGMVDGFMTISTRLALSFYVERRLGLDFAPDTISPNRQQIVLLNREEVEEARREAKQAIEQSHAK
jgi:hypothetical protein